MFAFEVSENYEELRKAAFSARTRKAEGAAIYRAIIDIKIKNRILTTIMHRSGRIDLLVNKKKQHLFDFSEYESTYKVIEFFFKNAEYIKKDMEQTKNIGIHKNTEINFYLLEKNQTYYAGLLPPSPSKEDNHYNLLYHLYYKVIRELYRLTHYLCMGESCSACPLGGIFQKCALKCVNERLKNLTP